MSVYLTQRDLLWWLSLLLVLCVGLWTAPTAAEQTAAAVSLYDSMSSSSEPLGGEAFARTNGWRKLPEGITDHRFAGDAIVLNNCLAVVLRRGGPGAEVYARGEKDRSLRAVLTPSNGAGGAWLEAIRIAENTGSSVALDASFHTPDGKMLGLRYELASGQLFVKTESRAGTRELCLLAPCRFAIQPDFFADDILVDASEIPVATAELPSENFLLHMLPGGRSIVMTVAGSRDYDARIDLSGEGPRRMIQRTRIRYGKDGKIWVAVIEGSGVWHQRDIAKEEAGKILALDWTWPFAAQWRVDWRQPDQLTSSSPLVVEQQVPNKRSYSCWIDPSGRGHLQPTSDRRFLGPAVLYPLDRTNKTPLDRFSIVDVARATLGVGPCEYILDVEGRRATMRGRSTCGTRDALKAIYAAKEQKAKQAEIEKILTEVVVFVKFIRARIDQYVVFGHALRGYLDEQKKGRPDLAQFLQEMEKLTAMIDTAFERRRSNIQTPEYVVDLTEKFRQTVLDYEGPDALEKCNAITNAIVVVGGNQDALVAECRQAVKILRQRSGLAMAIDPRTAEVAKEIRRRTQTALRNPVSYEAPRH